LELWTILLSYFVDVALVDMEENSRPPEFKIYLPIRERRKQIWERCDLSSDGLDMERLIYWLEVDFDYKRKEHPDIGVHFFNF
jgi:hypothetical protein